MALPTNAPVTPAAAPVVGGHPAATPADPAAASAAAPAAPAAAASPAAGAAAPAGAPAAAAASPIVYQGHSFPTAEALAAFVAQQHTAAQPPAAFRPAPAPAAPAQAELIDGQPIDQVMFNDPVRYNSYVVDKAKNAAVAEVRKDAASQENERQFWEELYTENADLRGQDWLVKSVLRETYDQIAPLPVSEAKQRLAIEARKRIDLIRSASGIEVQEMPSGRATTLGASGAGVPRVQTVETPVSFIDQVKAARKRRA